MMSALLAISDLLYKYYKVRYTTDEVYTTLIDNGISVVSGDNLHIVNKLLQQKRVRKTLLEE